jgi:antirestriction protein ArdC
MNGLPAAQCYSQLPEAFRPGAASHPYRAIGADIRHGGTRSDYADGPDYVQIPPFDTFRDAESGDVETPQARY